MIEKNNVNPYIMLMQGFRELYEKQEDERKAKDRKVVTFNEDIDKDKTPLELLKKAYSQDE